MADFSIPFLRIKKIATGFGYYWEPSATLKKQGWKPISLGVRPTDRDRALMDLAEKQNEKVEAWKVGGARPKEIRKIVQRHSMAHLISRFAAEHVAHKRPNTQREYLSKLATIERWTNLPSGSAPIVSIDRARVRALRDALMTPQADGTIRHTMAHGTLRVLRTLMQFAIDEGLYAGENPAERPGLSAPPPRRQIWAPEALATFVETATAMGNPSVGLAAVIGRDIGQREHDLLILSQRRWIEIPEYMMAKEDHATLSAGFGNVAGFRLRQSKTGTWVDLPVVGSTRVLVEAAIADARARGVTTILVEEGRDRPWNATRFQRRVAEIRERCVADALPPLRDSANEAGIPSLAVAAELAHLLRRPIEQIIALPAKAWVACPRDGRTKRLDYMGLRIAGEVTPVPQETRARVEACLQAARAAGADSLLVDEQHRKPWQIDYYLEQLEDQRYLAGAFGIDFLRLQFRDLRRTAVVWLASLGIEVHLIASLTGHTLDQTMAIMKVYMPATTGQSAKAVALRVERTPKIAGDKKEQQG